MATINSTAKHPTVKGQRSKNDQRSKVKDQSLTAGPLSKIDRFLLWILVICGVIGIFASIMVTVEKIDLISHPNQQFICDLNPIISCGSVMKSWQAHVFGFMNPFIGLLGFPVVVAVGMAMFAGAKFKRWFWLGMQIGLTLGIIFAYWLLWESIYRIRALCPYCLTTDVVLTTMWWYTTLYNFHHGHLTLPARLKAAGEFAKRHHADLLVFWFLIVIVVILNHFWYYFGPHLFHIG